MNIFDFPLYYISFERSDEIENHYKEHGFTNVNHFPAVDGRKLSVHRLMQDRIISIRVHDDLRMGRVEHSGMPSKGGIGCTLSHYELWKTCVEKNYPYIIITEEDNRIYDDELSKDTTKKILNIITKPNGMFVSAWVRNEGRYKNITRFRGTYMCILSQNACKQLIVKTFPIDGQTDWYISHMATIKNINLDGFRISKQKKVFLESTIQDIICINCFLPRGNILLFILLFIIILFVIVIFRNYKK